MRVRTEPPVTSASSIRPVDNTSPGVVVFPAYFPLLGPAPSAAIPTLTPPLGAFRRAQAARLPRNTPKPDPASWQAIAERSRHESPRDLASAYGVSYDTIRTVIRRANAAERAASAMVAD